MKDSPQIVQTFAQYVREFYETRGTAPSEELVDFVMDCPTRSEAKPRARYRINGGRSV